jgi:hypothetical protein
MSVCGLWQGPRRLVAVILDEDGYQRRPITVPLSPANTHHLLAYLAAIDIGMLILPERSHTLIAQALALPLPLRLVPDYLLDAIRTASGHNHRPPRNTALMLARWHTIPTLRPYLREFRPPPVPEKQLPLF